MPVDSDRQRDINRPVRHVAVPDLDIHAINKITGYTTSSGRLCQAAIPSITRSVMAEIACFDT